MLMQSENVKVLDSDIMGQCNSGGSDFDDDCTQLVTLGTHTIIDSDSINEGDEKETVTHLHENGRGVSEVYVA
jgi:hypothetical protein